MALRLGNTKTRQEHSPGRICGYRCYEGSVRQIQSKVRISRDHDQVKHHTGLTRWLQKIAAKDVPGITSHGLRHSFSSTAEDLGYSLPTIKALVGHARASVTEGYIHKIELRAARGCRSDRAAHRRNHDGKKIEQGRSVAKGLTTIGAARVAPEKLVRTSLPRRLSCARTSRGCRVFVPKG